MIDTIPRGLTPALLEFCQSISIERPRFIPSRPPKDAVLSECFNNVACKVARAGGSVEHGWAIWHLRGAYFEAEHHGVWRKRSGELVDVSPQINNARKILFLPDHTAVYDPMSYRSNRIEAASEDFVAKQFVELAKIRSSIIDLYRANGAKSAVFSDEDTVKIQIIDKKLQENLRILAGR